MTTHDGRREFCKKAIQSVLAQTYEDWELIIVDDASRDGTKVMVSEFKDPRIIYKYRDENYGTDTKPKNEGILLSKGKYIAFLDSDNTYRPDHLQALINVIEIENCDGVYGDRFIHINNEPHGVGVHSDFDPMLLMTRNYIDTSDVLLKREVLFDLGGFDERFKKFIDWNLWVRAAKAGKQFKRVPIVMTDYHIHDGSKSKRKEDTIDNFPAWNAFDCDVRLDYLGKKEPPKVAVFSLTYDRLAYTKECFDSMYKTAGYPIDVHVIVDNGSKDGTIEWVKEYCKTNDIELEVKNG